MGISIAVEKIRLSALARELRWAQRAHPEALITNAEIESLENYIEKTWPTPKSD